MRNDKENLIVKLSFEFALDIIEFTEIMRNDKENLIVKLSFEFALDIIEFTEEDDVI